MSKRVNFSRHLALDWLDQVAIQCSQGIELKTINENLERMLEPFVTCKVNRGKTRNQLINLWAKVPENINKSFNQVGFEFVQQNDSLPLILHWGQLVAKNLFFSDIVRFIGRKAKHGDSFTYAQIQKSLVEQYGGTETVKRALRSVLKTLVGFQIVKKETHRLYSPQKLSITVESKYKSWLMLALMHNQEVSSRSLNDLVDDLIWFPFELSVNINELSDSYFELHQQGNDLVLFRK